MTALFFVLSIRVNAIIFYATGDTNYNTTAPTGILTNSGWQYQGLWVGFLGTPIAPKYFITAAHVVGSIGDPLVVNGVSYPTSAVFDDPQTDLRIWRICGTFPEFAPLYTNDDEIGKTLVVFGRGTQRDAEVVVPNGVTSQLKGWQWGPYDGVQRWGENSVAQIINGDNVLGETGLGELLAANFDANGGLNECHLSRGDSAGAVFIQDGSTWKLAGINYAVDGPYNTTNTGTEFNAAIFDEGGLYKRAGTTWVLTADLPIPQPGSFYSTRISSRVAWINTILSAPLPPDSQPTLQVSSSPAGPYADVADVAIDDVSKTLIVPQPFGVQFYRLRSCSSLQIKSIQLQGGDVVMKYD